MTSEEATGGQSSAPAQQLSASGQRGSASGRQRPLIDLYRDFRAIQAHLMERQRPIPLALLVSTSVVRHRLGDMTRAELEADCRRHPYMLALMDDLESVTRRQRYVSRLRARLARRMRQYNESQAAIRRGDAYSSGVRNLRTSEINAVQRMADHVQERLEAVQRRMHDFYASTNASEATRTQRRQARRGRPLTAEESGALDYTVVADEEVVEGETQRGAAGGVAAGGEGAPGESV